MANFEEQKILLALYCINKGRMNNGCTKECDTEKCLCLDEEQLALLDQLFGTQIMCSLEDEEAAFFKTEEYNSAVPFCLKKQADSKRLIQFLNMDSGEIQTAISTTTGKIDGEVWREVLCGLPLLQTINIRCELTCRDSIAYWCLFGEDSEEFLRKLLKALCACLINRNHYGQDLQCVADYMESIFCKINELYKKDEFDECCRRFIQSIIQYEKKFREEKASLQVGCHSLKELYQRISGLSHKRNGTLKALTYIFDNNEASMNEIVQLYHLVKKIFAIFGITLGKVTEDFWQAKIKNATPHDDYSKLMEVLERISDKDEQTQTEIWQMFVLLITDEVECSSENVETFHAAFL